MEQKIIGELFGVQLHSPISRLEVREVLQRQLEFKTILQSNSGLTEEQAAEEIFDIFEPFLGSITNEERRDFERIHSEEVSTAPKEWFSGFNFEHADNNEPEVIYGVPISFPLTRKNIREVITAENQLINDLIRSGLTRHQAELDTGDMLVEFYTRIGRDKREEFSRLLTQEKIAEINHQADLNIENSKQQVEQQIQAVKSYSVLYAGIGIALVLLIFFILVSR